LAFNWSRQQERGPDGSSLAAEPSGRFLEDSCRVPICLHRCGKVHETAEPQLERPSLGIGEEGVDRGNEVGPCDRLGLE
jgi:hypothetical protein